MTIQLSVAARNARLSAIPTTIGTSAKLEIYTGSVPANCAASTTGTKLAEYDLASSYFNAPSAGAMVLSSLPITIAAVGNGVAGYFRLFASDGVTCGMQGTCTLTGSGGDLTFDNTNFVTSQNVNITGFTVTDGNA
jgi:hypothetical protein